MIGVPHPPESPPGARAIWSESLRYWEPRRLLYNAVLTSTVLTAVAWSGQWASAGRPLAWLGLVVAAALANLCYCAAYPVDLALQFSDLRPTWLRYRGWLFGLGCVLGVCLTLLTLPFALQGQV